MILIFHARGTPTIMARTFIKVEEISSASKVKARMFITLDGPPEAGESVAILIDYNTYRGAVHGISCPISIPPKPPDRVAASITSTCSDHC